MAIVPAFNEQGSLARSIDDLRSAPGNIRIVVVNDGSTDCTSEIARRDKRVVVLDLPVRLGIGGAVQTGLSFFLESDCDLVFQFDGDGQHRGDEISKLIDAVHDDTAMVIGSRFVGGNQTYEGSRRRRIGISILNWWTKVLTGIEVSDATSGFRIYSRETVKALKDLYPDDFPEPVVTVILARKMAAIKEIPVTMNQRAEGVSSLRGLAGPYYMAKVMIMMLLARFGGRTGA